MRSRLLDYVPDLNIPHLRLGGYGMYVSNQVSCILNKWIQDSAPKRWNFRGITIDWKDSLDLDDGVWAERTANGGYCLWIHISDVSEFVPPFSPLDLEALRRGTSIYRRDTTHNMFPSELANGTFSLDPSGGDKLTCTLQIDLDSDWGVTDYQFFESRFTNLRRYDYKSFWADYANPDSQHYSTLHLLNEISKKLRKKRLSQWGILNFDDDRWLTLDALHKQQEDSYSGAKCHKIIESLMVLANTIVWNHLAKQPWVKSLYRRHDLKEKFGFFYHKPCKHAGLGVQNYAQFTSPIRRFWDLVEHRILKALIRWGDLLYTDEDIRCIAEHANNVWFLVKTYWSQIKIESRGDELIEKAKIRLGRPPLLSDLKTFLKINVSRSNKLPRAIFQAISDNINNQPLDTWIWAVGVILLSQETELKKLLKDKILNHVGLRIRGFLNVLWQTRITIWEDPLFVVDENERAGKYSIQIFCRGALISQKSCTTWGKNRHRDLPHQCRREAVEQLFDFFINP